MKQFDFTGNDTVKCYWASLVILDTMISKIETDIYMQVIREYHNQQEVDAVIHGKGFSHPLSLVRNNFLWQRNVIATILGIKNREIHDTSKNALGYRRYGENYAIILPNGGLSALSFVVGV